MIYDCKSLSNPLSCKVFSNKQALDSAMNSTANMAHESQKIPVNLTPQI